MLPGLKNAKLEKYSHYMVEASSLKKVRVTRLVHSDVCGPLKVKSFSGALYFVTFIDNCSRKLWVYALKSKDQALVERQSGKKVKCIRYDNSDEYYGPFNVYCKQQDRMNRTLIERFRCMLSETRLPKHFWGETLYIAVHVINLSLVVDLNAEVLDKIWFDKDIKYDHLQVFGCKAFVHVPKDERSKLDMKTI
ncbi:hypothetical protein CR513_38245, partial [Mucuna pruriens]